MVAKSGFPELAERVGIKLGVVFSHIPLTPNQWTVISIIPAIFGFIALAYFRDMGTALVLFILSGLVDAIDGGVARVTGSVSNLGAYLDGMFDRFVEALLLIGLMLFGLPDLIIGGHSTPMWLWLTLLLFLGTCMVSFARAYADHRKALTDPKKLRKMGGVLERAERLGIVFLGMLLWYYSPLYLNVLVAAAVLLSLITLFQRMWFVVGHAE